MVGPSAIGSENGTPSSITSAPARTSACITGTVASNDGSPAVMKGISALRPLARSSAKQESIRRMKSLEQGRKAGRHLTSGGKEIPHQRKAQRKQVAVGKSIDAEHRVAAARTPRTKRGHQATSDQRRDH